MSRIKALLLLSVLVIFSRKGSADISLGQCSLNCDVNPSQLVDSRSDVRGRVGKQGPKGDKGEMGEHGPQGIKGSVGEVGANGVQGIQGIKGEPGQSCICPDVEALEQKLISMNEKIMQLENQQAYYNWAFLPTDCSQLNEERKSGIYQLRPFANNNNATPVRVLCDMDTSGGGWTVFQRRVDGSVDFYRGWQEYVDGFGDIEGEFWLGLENIHQLTTKYNMMLRVDLEDRDGNRAYAQYSTFKVAGSVDNYRLTIGGYSGTAGDSLDYHNNMMFTTHDRDNDRGSSTNCAEKYHGAWWYNACHVSHLNGDYSVVEGGSGVTWHHWKNNKVGMKSTQMSIKRI